MKTILSIVASLALLATLAGHSSARDFKPSGGTIKVGPIKPICQTKPKACGEGYDPLKKPHVPTTPK